MRVLLDENLPHDLIAELIGHEVMTVQGVGWSGVKNGDLLRRAAGQIDAFVTMDRKLEKSGVNANEPIRSAFAFRPLFPSGWVGL